MSLVGFVLGVFAFELPQKLLLPSRLIVLRRKLEQPFGELFERLRVLALAHFGFRFSPRFSIFRDHASDIAFAMRSFVCRERAGMSPPPDSLRASAIRFALRLRRLSLFAVRSPLSFFVAA